MRMNRRQFMGGAAAVAAAGVMGRMAWADPLGLPLGIQLYTVRDPMMKDTVGTVKQIAGMGYKEVETAGYGTIKTAAEFRKVLDDAGLKCPSAHLQWDINNLQKSFDDAKALGCKYATASVPKQLIQEKMTKSPAEMSDAERAAWRAKMVAPLTGDDFKKLAEVMNKVGEEAKKNGLVFAAHNHTMEFALVDGVPGYDYLLKNTNPANVKFEIDCGWITVAGYKPGDYVKKFPGRIKMLHIKDFSSWESGKTGESAKGTEIGKGKVDYKAIFASVKGTGVEHIFVEQEAPYTLPPLEAAKADFDYLHSLS
ncbi:sugar phosphate isomerase/epimerase family protein [Terriglobus sp. 2YAB30_2]|uniref:sugar phosphate isomerase/epimerase family protein n=1 Tax=Terriglobus sp. 2YAB30_2 TaxID=3233023 RepID=UPI003F9E81F7